MKLPPRTSKQDGLHGLAAVQPLQNPTSSKKLRGKGRKGRERYGIPLQHSTQKKYKELKEEIGSNVEEVNSLMRECTFRE